MVNANDAIWNTLANFNRFLRPGFSFGALKYKTTRAIVAK